MTANTEVGNDDYGCIPCLQSAYHKQRESMFFNKLPSEIRVEIYAYLLIAHGVISPNNQPIDVWHNRYSLEDHVVNEQAPGLHATIARTCRASLYEAYPILYGQNVFSFYTSYHIHCFEQTGLSMYLQALLEVQSNFEQIVVTPCLLY